MSEQQVINSSLWAALGDALGYVTELGDEAKFSYRLNKKTNEWGKSSWKRKIGGRYGCQVELAAGTYSDDTQLRLAVSRSINSEGIFQKEAFAKIELPIWRSYALGAGIASTTAAENLTKVSVNWNSNFFKNKRSDYCKGGGNGAAMRIQPHIWAVSNWQHPHHYLPDVISNAIITHGHARGILGAAFHAICLAMTLANKKPLSQPLWHETLPFLKNIPTIIDKNFSLSKVWLPQWEAETGVSFSAQLAEVIEEFKEYFSEFTRHTEGSPKERYHAFARSIRAVGGREVGSAVKTSVLASAAALLFENEPPLDCLQTIASLFGSDTDTIATMAGALIGATTEEEPELPLQDRDYLKSEAKRLNLISQGAVARGFTYPSILSWKSPRSALDIVLKHGQDFYLDGLAKVTFFGEEYGNNQAIWQWGKLDFGQTILVKRRKEDCVVTSQPARGRYLDTASSPNQTLHHSPMGEPKKSSASLAYQTSLLGGGIEQTQKQESLRHAPRDEVLRLVDSIVKKGFPAKDIGEAYLYLRKKYRDYAYVAEFTLLLYKNQNKLQE